MKVTIKPGAIYAQTIGQMKKATGFSNWRIQMCGDVYSNDEQENAICDAWRFLSDVKNKDKSMSEVSFVDWSNTIRISNDCNMYFNDIKVISYDGTCGATVCCPQRHLSKCFKECITLLFKAYKADLNIVCIN